MGWFSSDDKDQARADKMVLDWAIRKMKERQERKRREREEQEQAERKMAEEFFHGKEQKKKGGLFG